MARPREKPFPSRTELIASIRDTAASIDGVLSYQAWRSRTRFYKRHLDAAALWPWSLAKKAAEVPSTPKGRPPKFTRRQLLDALRDFASEHGGYLTEACFEHGVEPKPPFSIATVRTHFKRDSLRSALEAAGIPRRTMRGVKNQHLLAMLRRRAAELIRPVRPGDLTKPWPGVHLYTARFGSLEAALQLAGLPTENLISDIELLERVRSLAVRLRRAPTAAEVMQTGYAVWIYIARFETWNCALQAAGIEPTKRMSIPTIELLDELQRLEIVLGKVPSQADMDRDGRFSSSVYSTRFQGWSRAVQAAGFAVRETVRLEEADVSAKLRRLERERSGPLSLADVEAAGIGRKVIDRLYGSWGNARRIAGIEVGRLFRVARELLLDDLKLVADTLHQNALTMADYVAFGGRYHPCTIVRKLSGWNAALLQAGLQPVREMGATHEQLRNELIRLHAELGRTPMRDEINNLGRYGASVYYARFGNLSDAARDAGLEPHGSYAVRTDGDDGHTYDSAAEAGFANRLLRLRIAGEIADYEPHVELEDGERWTVDFAVELVDGLTVLVEFDGLGPARVPSYSSDSPKMRAFARRGAPLIIVSNYRYVPSCGRLIRVADFERTIKNFVA